MSLVIKQNGIDVTSSISMDSLQLKQVLTKEVSTLSFDIKIVSGKAVILAGDTILFIENGVTIFGGTVTTIENIVSGGILILQTVSCVDWSFRMNTKLVAKNYAAMDPADIVSDIISNFTDGSYTTNNVIRGNFLVSTIKFNYEHVTVSIEKLAKQIGWEWYVDYNKDLHFFPPSLVTSAPFNIDDSSGNLNWNTLDITEDLTNMKNSVYVVGGTYVKNFTSSTTPDVYMTDGIKSVFSLAYPYHKAKMTITLAGVSQTIGTDQVTPDSSVQVQYNDSGRFIRFTSIPATGQTVVIYGNAKIPILAHTQDDAAVTAYGEQQDVIIDKNIKSVTEAQERAGAEIYLYGHPVYTVKFDTLKTGLFIGQTININSTKFGVNINPVIKEIDGRLYSPTQMIYSITAIGSDVVSLNDLMKVLILQANSDNTVDDSTVLQVLKSVSESTTIADALLAPTVTSPPYRWTSGTTTARWNFSTWA